MTRILTIEGDHLDALIGDHYGIAAAATALQAVLLANPGLAAYGPTLPAGVRISFPELAPADEPVLRLWD